MIGIIIQFIGVCIIVVKAQQDPHLCKYTEMFVAEVKVTENEPYEVWETKWCWKLLPRCRESKTMTRVVTKSRPITHTRAIWRCCSGYTMSETGRKCLPQCAQECGPHGECTAAEICTCEQGYAGDTCEICLKCGGPCPKEKWGTNCTQTCTCKNNSPCDQHTGECLCTAGWRGKDCGTPCPASYFGQNCTEKCPNTTCDHVTGQNICRPGYTGEHCEIPCPIGSWGSACNGTCSCRHNATCELATGRCLCTDGWTGEECDSPCPPQRYGPDCSHHCLCSNNSMCRGTDGFCICSPGYSGKYCMEKCLYGYYGDHCNTPCQCKSDNFICSHMEGCVCPSNWTGENCDIDIRLKYDTDMWRNTIEQANEPSIWPIILVSIFGSILTIVSVGAVYYYIRRYRRLQERLTVRYTANSFAPVNSVELSLNNRNMIVNDLGTRRTPSVSAPSAMDTRPSEEEAEYSDLLLKNVNADKSNPNMPAVDNQVYMSMEKIVEESEPFYENVNLNHATTSKINK